MFTLPSPGDAKLSVLSDVVSAALTAAPGLRADEVMIVGAHCRDILHEALGHTLPTRATRDLDLALALSSWDNYVALSQAFPSTGSNGIAYRIADLPVDLLAFGDVENPEGTVTPPARGEGLSVWAFAEVFQTSIGLDLGHGTTIRIPTIPGYAATKLAAWLDRSAYGQLKDARDIALTLYWYAESSNVQDLLYESEDGNDVLMQADMDVPLAAAALLGRDVATVIGPVRTSELLERWTATDEQLIANLTISDVPTWSAERRRGLVLSLTRGLRQRV